MPASKAKLKVKKTLKAKSPVKVKAKVRAKPKVVAKAKPSVKPILVKTVEKKHAPPHQQKHESFFERLLREKAERHAQHQAQNAHGHQPHDQNMPANHARYSKFAGPRRRAS